MPYRLMVRAASRATGRLGWLRGAIGALLAIGLAALAAKTAVGAAPSWPWLLAPVGASAVLVFALPASPLAQPWPVIGGNMISAAIGFIAAHFVTLPILAAAIAVAAAIGAMSMCRCLHPPGGACALLTALGGPAVTLHGWAGLLLPLALNLVALLAAAWVYNNLTGHRWPHAPRGATADQPARWAGSYVREDLDTVLEEWDEVLDVSREDLDALFRALERQVERRWREGPRP